MPGPDRFRDAATVRVDAPVDRVRALISDPAILQSVDERLTGEDIEIHRQGDRVEVHADEDRLHLAFRLRERGESTQIAALEDVEPEGLVEQTKRMLFPGQAHRDLEDELDRFRHIAEAFDTARSR